MLKTMTVEHGSWSAQTIRKLRYSARFVAIAATLLLLSSPANAFVANASDLAASDPIAAAPTTPRWNANSRALVDSGERGLGGGLEFSVDSAFCTSLNFVDQTTCADIRALIVEAGEKWGEENPNIYLVDVTELITAREPGNFATELELGAEINFFARSRDVMEGEAERAAASAGTMVNNSKPQSTNGTTLWGAEGTITHASVHFTTDNCYYLLTPVAPGVCVPFGLILLHEIGHVLGLGHPDELTHWNLDSDEDASTPIEIQCQNPLAGLRHSESYDPDSMMISNQTANQEWESALRLDDYAGRDFLYPVCTEEELSSAPSLAITNAPMPTLSIPVNANFYPIDSLIQNEEGRVLLNLTIAPDRSVASAELHTSSDYPRLDEAAIAIAGNSRFTTNQEAETGNGSEVILGEVVWQLPLRPAFDVGALSSNAINLEAPPHLVDLPADQNLARVPDASAVAGDQGVVRVRTTVSESGNALKTELVETSGFVALDNAAITLANASGYDPATSAGLPVEASLEMAFAYDTLPGKPSPRCYPYPTDVNLPTIRMAYFSNANVPENENPSAERWIMVDEAGEIETMILATERGWMHVDDVLKQRWVPSVIVPENHPQQSCWYYRPFSIPRL